MDIGFRVEVVWSDTDIFEIRVSAWNGSFGGSADVYVAIGGLKEAAAKLEGFPRSASDSRELVFGGFGKEWAGGAVNMRFYCPDAAGHAFVVAKIESDHDKTHGAQSVVLFVPIEAAAVDTFVEGLRRLEIDEKSIAVLKAR